MWTVRFVDGTSKFAWITVEKTLIIAVFYRNKADAADIETYYSFNKDANEEGGSK